MILVCFKIKIAMCKKKPMNVTWQNSLIALENIHIHKKIFYFCGLNNNKKLSFVLTFYFQNIHSKCYKIPAEEANDTLLITIIFTITF